MKCLIKIMSKAAVSLVQGDLRLEDNIGYIMR
jgi:hypothetical protein